NLDVLQFRGRVGAYLEPMPGIASLNLLKLIRPELMIELRTALQRARMENTPALVVSASPPEDAAPRGLEIEVIPIEDPGSASRCFLVLFRDALRGAQESAVPIEAAPGDRRLGELERQLQATKEYLQSTIEELESANEELK